MMSLPTPIRNYQSVFLKALRERYPRKIITAQPGSTSMTLVTVMKNDGDSGWTRCEEEQEISEWIMLPGYKAWSKTGSCCQR